MLLSATPDEFTVFHPYNSHLVEMGDVIEAMNAAGVSVEIVEDDEFEEKLHAALADDRHNQYLSPLVGYSLDDDAIRVENLVDHKFTVKALYRLGFKWSQTDGDYIRLSVEMLKALGFFDVDMND